MALEELQLARAPNSSRAMFWPTAGRRLSRNWSAGIEAVSVEIHAECRPRAVCRARALRWLRSAKRQGGLDTAVAFARRIDAVEGQRKVALERFPAKWTPVRVKKNASQTKLEPPFRFNRNGQRL